LRRYTKHTILLLLLVVVVVVVVVVALFARGSRATLFRADGAVRYDALRYAALR
jgi:uncharacterized membrane protein YqiK